MPSELVLPAIAMTFAFVCYTTGVWAERAAHDLRWWHVGAFWSGLAFDVWGTALMEGLRDAGQRPTLLHAATGAAALALMGGHAAWALWVAAKGTPEARRGFERNSSKVWLVWLVPYLGGMVAGISRGLGG